MKYDVWAVNGYDSTEMYRIGEHLTKEEAEKLYRDPDHFDCMYQPRVYEENTMNDRTMEFRKPLPVEPEEGLYDVIECSFNWVGDPVERVIRSALSKLEAEQAKKELAVENDADYSNSHELCYYITEHVA